MRRLFLLASLLILLGCGAGASAPPVLEQSCGLAIPDRDARIWVQGPDAEQACQFITYKMEDETGGELIEWDGTPPDTTFAFETVCSDELEGFKYEVKDVGIKLFGTAWCNMMVEWYGTSDNPRGPHD